MKKSRRGNSPDTARDAVCKDTSVRWETWEKVHWLQEMMYIYVQIREIEFKIVTRGEGGAGRSAVSLVEKKERSR